jgi:hypothetical protein
MANGFWGSRIPLANFIASRSIFACMHWRLATPEAINLLVIAERYSFQRFKELTDGAV